MKKELPLIKVCWLFYIINVDYFILYCESFILLKRISYFLFQKLYYIYFISLKKWFDFDISHTKKACQKNPGKYHIDFECMR